MTEATYDLVLAGRGAAAPAAAASAARCSRPSRTSCRQRGGHVIRVETSSLEGQGGARRFYEKTGFRLAGAIPDFYRAGRRPAGVRQGAVMRAASRLLITRCAGNALRRGRDARLSPRTAAAATAAATPAAGRDRAREPGAAAREGPDSTRSPSRASCAACWRHPGCSPRPARTRVRRPPRGRGSRSRRRPSKRARRARRAPACACASTRGRPTRRERSRSISRGRASSRTPSRRPPATGRASRPSRRRRRATPSLTALVTRIARDLVEGVAAPAPAAGGIAGRGARRAGGGRRRAARGGDPDRRRAPAARRGPDAAQAARAPTTSRCATRRWAR